MIGFSLTAIYLQVSKITIGSSFTVTELQLPHLTRLDSLAHSPSTHHPAPAPLAPGSWGDHTPPLEGGKEALGAEACRTVLADGLLVQRNARGGGCRHCCRSLVWVRVPVEGACLLGLMVKLLCSSGELP